MSGRARPSGRREDPARLADGERPAKGRSGSSASSAFPPTQHLYRRQQPPSLPLYSQTNDAGGRGSALHRIYWAKKHPRTAVRRSSVRLVLI